MRALIVSDDETTQRHLTALLSPAGHEAAPAPSADQARHLLTQADFSVIFVEMARLTLPEIQLLGAARAHRNFQPYCILLTGPADSAQIISGLNAGADDFLNRDCSAAELQARLRVAERSLQLQQSLANTHQRLRHELESAAQVQRAHLPPRAPRFGKSSLAWAYVPCEAVGGDFLNAFHLDREQVGMYMLDVSGHGVSSALMSLAINQSLSATPNETNVVNRPIRSSGRGVTAIHSTPPAQVVERVNVRFPADKETGKFFTLLYGIVDLSKGVFRFTSAGHPEPILQRAFGEPEIVPVPTNLPIGMALPGDDAYQEYSESSLQLRPGDRIWLYSDGVTEAMNPRQEQFGESRLLASIKAASGGGVQSAVDSLLGDVTAWCAPAAAHDDISIMAFEFR